MNKSIGELPEVTCLHPDDVIPIFTGGTTKKITIKNLCESFEKIIKHRRLLEESGNKIGEITEDFFYLITNNY